MPVTKLYLIRHGQSAGNAEGRFGGHGPTPLSELGVKQAEATAALAAATVAKPGVTQTAEAADSEAKAAATVVAEFSAPRLLRKASQSVVLWVDDHQENQAYERQARESVGIRVVMAPST